jgi:hypothetical protein
VPSARGSLSRAHPGASRPLCPHPLLLRATRTMPLRESRLHLQPDPPVSLASEAAQPALRPRIRLVRRGLPDSGPASGKVHVSSRAGEVALPSSWPYVLTLLAGTSTDCRSTTKANDSVWTSMPRSGMALRSTHSRYVSRRGFYSHSNLDGISRSGMRRPQLQSRCVLYDWIQVLANIIVAGLAS